MSNKSKTRHFYRKQSHLNITPPGYHPVHLVLVLLFTALFIGWLLGLGSVVEDLAEPVPPISVMTIIGTINARLPIEVTCGEHTITARTVAESSHDVQPDLPAQLTFESLEPLVEAYYILAAPYLQLKLELHDSYGNVTRRFEAVAGTVDIRKHGIYIAAQLRDDTSALIYLSAQTYCQANV